MESYREQKVLNKPEYVSQRHKHLELKISNINSSDEIV